MNALAALDEQDHSTCTRLLERLVAMTEREARDEGGIHEVLSAEDSLADDVAGDRNERRAGEGFVAPADARAFLKLSRESTDEHGRDAVTKAYFRELNHTPRKRVAAPRLLRMIEEAELARAVGRRALPSPKPTLVASILAELDDAPRTERMEELAFLVNVLLAGDKKHWRPAEAAEAVVAIVEHGLATIGSSSKRSAKTIVAEDGIVPAFRVGVREGKLDERKRDRRQ